MRLRPGVVPSSEMDGRAWSKWCLEQGKDRVLTPSQITGNTDNYSPTGMQTATVLRLSTDASRNLTGIVPHERELKVFNVGSQDIVLVNDATSTAANRFLLGANVTLGANEGIFLWYDEASSRWRSAGKHV